MKRTLLIVLGLATIGVGIYYGIIVTFPTKAWSQTKPPTDFVYKRVKTVKLLCGEASSCGGPPGQNYSCVYDERPYDCGQNAVIAVFDRNYGFTYPPTKHFLMYIDGVLFSPGLSNRAEAGTPNTCPDPPTGWQETECIEVDLVTLCANTK